MGDNGFSKFKKPDPSWFRLFCEAKFMNRSEILDALDPDWRARYRSDEELAWSFYYQYAREDIERIKRESQS